MDKKIFAESKNKIHRYVAERRLRDAFSYARSLAATLRCADIDEEIARAEQSYRYMLEYAARGAEDPGRDAMVQELGATVLEAVDRLERENLRAAEPAIYFNTLRYEATRKGVTIGSLLQAYKALAAEASIFNVVTTGVHSPKAKRSALEREELEKQLFNKVWVTHPLSAADEEELRNALTGSALPPYVRELLAWAVTMGGLHYFDSRRVGLLLSCYTTEQPRLWSAGIIGVGLMLAAWPGRRLSRAVSAQLAAARELPTWLSDLRMVNMELVKTIDTDRITRKIQDEVVPGMMKLKPEIDKKLKQNKIEELDPSEMEENPEWQALLENSGVADRLKEMTEIQQEGGDVMMGTFSHLKTFPFFAEVANWFLPFHSDYSAFVGEGSHSMQMVAEVIDAAPFLCDSDKYSFMFSLEQVPAQQRELMMSQFQAHESQLAELRAASLNLPDADRRGMVNRQIQNLFRFFRLYRRKGEMPNPFTEGVNLAGVELFASELRDAEVLSLIGEFYFSHGYYAKALEAFTLVGQLTLPGADIYQKMGHARQKLGDYAGAAADYERAEMLDSRSDWTLRRLARCYMALHRPTEALERLKVLEDRHPDHAGTALNIGRCLVELGRYDEAVHAYYKAEYLDSRSTKALRPLAWCLLMLRDLPQSRKYYERVIAESDPTPEDYLNLGHLAMAEGNFSEAMNLYSLNISARSAGKQLTGTERAAVVDGFIADMKADAPYLRRAGVDPELVPLIIDSILYNS